MRGRAVAAGLSIALGGCSLVYSKGRPKVGDPPTHYVQCTNVYGPIVIDALVALSYTALTIAAIQNADNSDSMSDGDNAGAYAALFILPAVFAASGIYGFVNVDACSKHHEAWARLHPESPNGPVMQPVPMYPPVPPSPATMPGQTQPGPYPHPMPPAGQPPAGQPSGTMPPAGNQQPPPSS